MLLTVQVSLQGNAETEGPWRYDDYRTGSCSPDINYSISFYGLNNSKWNANIYKWQDDDGIGFTVEGNAIPASKQCVYSTYSCSYDIPSYARLRLEWSYQLRMHTTFHWHTCALYMMDSSDALKKLSVDFTETYTNQYGSHLCLNHLTQTTAGDANQSYTGTIVFDNSSGSSNRTMSKALLLTHTIGNNGDNKAFVHDWASFKHLSSTYNYDYYKYLTYHSNGGIGGPMGSQTIMNSGKLEANQFTREGYAFIGWRTAPYGGTAYSDGGTITASSNDKGPVTIYAQWVSLPSSTHAEFNQLERKVHLSWQTRPGSYARGQYVIYRNGTKIGKIPFASDTYAVSSAFDDTEQNGLPYESDITYDIYIVLDGWDENTKRADMHTALSVSTQRSVPVSDFNAKSEEDRIVLTWNSDPYPAAFGNQFRIYIDNETEPAYTITPSNNQNAYRWEHVTTDQHTDRQNGVSNEVPYTEEPISGLVPHSYRVDGVIGDAPLGTASVDRRSINRGTLFYSIDATKDAYQGSVKLSWHVNRQGSPYTQNYAVDRRRAERPNDRWITLYETQTTDEYLYYTDDSPLPGVCYEYRVTVTERRTDGTIIVNDTSDIGFSKATGTISGRVTYGSTGVAVKGVDVVVKQLNDDNNAEQYHSMRFTGNDGKLKWSYPSKNYAAETFADGDWSIQMWLNPDTVKTQPIVCLNGSLCYIGMNDAGQLTVHTDQDTYTFDSAVVVNRYCHLTLTRSGATLRAYVISMDMDGLPVTHTSAVSLSGSLNLSDAMQFSIGGFTGYVDEFRIWNKALTQGEVEENYNHLLVGNEANLEAYWTFDEGLNTRFFDYSREGTVYNAHHGRVGISTQSSLCTPEQLALRATTDQDGNYIIRGVPFSGEGTTYAIIPALGIHSFNPTQQLRLVSNNSLIHNSTDFDDVSSFPVSGTVYYAGTDYPVEGCNLYVDGQICSKEGELIETDRDGVFHISVPIGEHAIQVKKSGHVFTSAGRFPPKPDTYYNFSQEMKNLRFTDETVVNLTGRVVGGDIEGNKEVGFGLSTNNIGAATITLQAQNDNYRLNVVKVTDGAVESYETNPQTEGMSSATERINSASWRGAGDNCNRFYIRTDSATGEFSALIPPLVYTVSKIHVGSSNLDVIETPISVDLSNPQMIRKDSFEVTEGKKEFYEYHTLLRPTYHSEPTFNVVQRGHTDGSFGIDSLDIEDVYGTLHLTDIHHINADTVEYTYGAPLFKMLDQYVFDIEGYEEYINNDVAEPVTSHVPLANVMVTVKNALSDQQEVFDESNPTENEPGKVSHLQDDRFALDSMGIAHYRWWGGLPNITPPYSRTINMYYEIDGKQNSWSGNPLTGILLGDFPTGNNFVTRGPDQLDMILRDPPGSQSYASWEEGTISQHITCNKSSFFTNNTVSTVQYIGVEMETGFGIGTFAINETKVMADLSEDVIISHEKWKSNSYTRTITRTQAISTSDDPLFDGADGDVFIGSSTNIIFGKCRRLDLYRNPKDSTKAFIGLRDSITSGLTFGTQFSYTQRYIQQTLLPNLKQLRDSYLTYHAHPESFVNTTDEPMYLTSLLPSDPAYGELDTYRMVVPQNDTCTYTDTVAYFSNQIRIWTSHLKRNEEKKVEAYEKRDSPGYSKYVKNFSFDAGSSRTVTYEKDTISSGTGYTMVQECGVFGAVSGGTFNRVGLEISVSSQDGGKQENDSTDGTAYSTVFKYTLKDTDINDAISVDVYENSLPYGAPIFRTRGGQTSNPYEGEVRTQYHEPGTVIMEATMQVENPKIEVVNPFITDVPSGTAANFTLRLANQSEVNADCIFKLSMIDRTNPSGAQLIIDGVPLTEDGRLIRVPYGETLVKSMQLRQSDPSILDYSNIAIVLASRTQYTLADTVSVSAQFVPSSSPVALEVNTHTINIHTDTVLTLTMKDFDRTYYNLKAFRMQYKPQGGDWTLLHEYVLNPEGMSSVSELLPSEGAKINYSLDLKNYADGTYRFRIVSVSTFGTDEVFVYSNEETVIKDTGRPRPLGQAEPADGILDIGDELSITYNIPFVSGELTTTKNFLVTGVLNGAKVEHLTALHAYNDTAHSVAETEANINLSGKDYSLDVWLYIQSEGVLLSHGSDKQRMSIATDAQKHLIISFADSIYTSQALVPYNKWVFFTMSRDVEGDIRQMSASIAYDDVILPLFADKEVPLYYGNGPISVGGGAVAAVHELLLWDEARDIHTALSERSVTKSPSTRHLIGYWKMNEGEGTFIRDYARNRHMIMRDESWYLNNINKAVTLNDSQYIALCTANTPPLPQDDYAMEIWVQSNAQKDTAQLMQLGEISLWMDDDGNVHLQSNGFEQAASHHPINDGAWHHVLLNVRRFGTGAVYVDGNRALTVSASSIGSFAADSLFVGVRRTFVNETDSTIAHYVYDRYLTGSVDEIRIWKTTIASDMLASKRKLRLKGDEPGLNLYYPFETKGLDENSQAVVLGTMEEMTGHGTAATINGKMVNYVDDAPSLKEKPTQTNVAFSFTASDTKIVIDIDEEPAAVDGCTLNFTVKDVHSVNGNPSLPATWTAFVHRNELTWADNELTIVKKVDDTFTISTALINRSGTPQRWSLSELPTSLTASSTSGMLDPLEKVTITFRCRETAPLGKHERTIYAMGNNGVPAPLTLHVVVTGDIPDWSVNPADYETSMNVISELDFFGHISDDEDDILAAFIGDECRGVTFSEYKDRYDGFYQTLTVYGKAEDVGKSVRFQAYRASTGTYYTLVTPNLPITFRPLTIQGRYDEPVILSVNDQIVQQTVLKKGWNWLSFFTEANDMTPQSVFANIADDVEVIKGRTNEIGCLVRTDTGWFGTMEPLLCRRSYMVKMKNERELRLVGKSINPATHTVRIHKDWGWPGYYGLHRISISNALSGADPQNGDMVRTQRATAYFDDYEWVGSLQTLEPGQGFAYYSVTDEEKWFAYPSSSVAATPRRQIINHKAETTNEVNEYAYPYNMILIGQVLYDKAPVVNAELGIFDGDECRSVANTDADGRVIMMIAGEEETVLNYKLMLNDQVFETVETLHYLTDDIVGTPDAPHIIHFGEGQSVENVQGDKVQCTKILRDGNLFILRNGSIYTATGAEVK